MLLKWFFFFLVFLVDESFAQDSVDDNFHTICGEVDTREDVDQVRRSLALELSVEQVGFETAHLSLDHRSASWRSLADVAENREEYTSAADLLDRQAVQCAGLIAEYHRIVFLLSESEEDLLVLLGIDAVPPQQICEGIADFVADSRMRRSPTCVTIGFGGLLDPPKTDP